MPLKEEFGLVSETAEMLGVCPDISASGGQRKDHGVPTPGQ